MQELMELSMDMASAARDIIKDNYVNPYGIATLFSRERAA